MFPLTETSPLLSLSLPPASSPLTKGSWDLYLFLSSYLSLSPSPQCNLVQRVLLAGISHDNILPKCQNITPGQPSERQLS